MLQQVIALLVISFLVVKLVIQRKRGRIGGNEFIFWLVFWILAMAAIASLKWIDILVASLGFSGPGIEVILYIAVPVLFYFIFRLRLRLEKMERDLTAIVRDAAIKRSDK